MFRNKKGALELSITAIVVLIIAITVLGLAIFFIKNLFGESTELIGSQLQQVKEQLRSNMEDTGELVVFSKGTEFKVKRGEKIDFYIGVRNQGQDTLCYRVSMRCISPFKTEGSCTVDQVKDVIVGGYDTLGQNWFPRLLETFEVEAGDIAVMPVTMQIVGAPDTYSAAMDVYEADGNCDQGSFGDSPWQSKRFHVELR